MAKKLVMTESQVNVEKKKFIKLLGKMSVTLANQNYSKITKTLVQASFDALREKFQSAKTGDELSHSIILLKIAIDTLENNHYDLEVSK